MYVASISSQHRKQQPTGTQLQYFVTINSDNFSVLMQQTTLSPVCTESAMQLTRWIAPNAIDKVDCTRDTYIDKATPTCNYVSSPPPTSLIE